MNTNHHTVHIYIYFDADEIYFDESYIESDGFTADIYMQELNNDDDKYRVITLNNVESTTDNRYITIKEGASIKNEKKSESVNIKVKYRTISQKRIFIFVIIYIVLISFLYNRLFIKSRNTEMKPYWLILCLILSCLSYYLILIRAIEVNLYSALRCMILIILYLLSVVMFISASKKTCKINGFTFYTIIIGFISLVLLTRIFAIYYIKIGNITDIKHINGHSHYLLENEKDIIFYALRYYFQLPSYEEQTFMHIFQMIIGRIFEVLVFGSVANYLINQTNNKVNIKNNNEIYESENIIVHNRYYEQEPDEYETKPNKLYNEILKDD